MQVKMRRDGDVDSYCRSWHAYVVVSLAKAKLWVMELLRAYCLHWPRFFGGYNVLTGLCLISFVEDKQGLIWVVGSTVL